MTNTELTAFINLFLSAAFVAIIGYVGVKLVQLRANVPKVLALLPADLQKALQDAAKFGSEFVEQMDKNGQLQPLLDALKSKGEQKLGLAVDYACQYIESVFKQNGYEVNVDEAQIKALIQKYVWDNPQLFPSSKTTVSE